MALTYGFDLGSQSGTFTASQFCDTVAHALGDGVTRWGGGFLMTLGSGFDVSVAAGYLLAAGRWLLSTGAETLTILPALTTADRYDAIAARVDLDARTASLEVLYDIDPDGPTQSDTEYIMYLYVIRVRRGATILYGEDVTDLRKSIPPLSELSAGTERAYTYLPDGFQDDVATFAEQAEAAVAREAETIAKVSAKAAEVGGTSVGDVEYAAVRPNPAGAWLLCDGTAVPAAYAALSELLDGTLPDITPPDGRLSAWIYGGEPA